MQSFDRIILVLYGAITIFFIYRLFKQIKDKKMLGEDAKAFKKPISLSRVSHQENANFFH